MTNYPLCEKLSIERIFVAQIKKDNWDCFKWEIIINKGYKVMNFPYYCGLAHVVKGRPKAPSNADIMYSLTLDYSYSDYTFDLFCNELGYSNDSTNSLEIYKAILKQSKELKQLFSPSEIEAIQQELQDY